MEYIIVYNTDPNNGLCKAYIPDFPSCKVIGKDKQDASNMIISKFYDMIDDIRIKDKCLPKPSSLEKLLIPKNNTTSVSSVLV